MDSVAGCHWTLCTFLSLENGRSDTAVSAVAARPPPLLLSMTLLVVEDVDRSLVLLRTWNASVYYNKTTSGSNRFSTRHFRRLSPGTSAVVAPSEQSKLPPMSFHIETFVVDMLQPRGLVRNVVKLAGERRLESTCVGWW